MESELVQLASVYTAPGFLLLAQGEGGERLGCVGLRPLPGSGPLMGEIRRLFVRQEERGERRGHRLAEALMARARVAGFEQLVLNTLPEMTEAVRLYESLGFARIEPYVDEPLEETLYYGLHLSARTIASVT